MELTVFSSLHLLLPLAPPPPAPAVTPLVPSGSVHVTLPCHATKDVPTTGIQCEHTFSLCALCCWCGGGVAVVVRGERFVISELVRELTTPPPRPPVIPRPC